MKIKQKLIHPRVINYVLHIERTLTFQFMSGQVAAFISAGSSCSPHLSGERRLLIFNYFSEVYMTTFPQLLLYNSAIQQFFFLLLLTAFFLSSFQCGKRSSTSWHLSSFSTSLHILPERAGVAANCCPGASEPYTTPICPHRCSGNRHELLLSHRSYR